MKFYLLMIAIFTLTACSSNKDSNSISLSEEANTTQQKHSEYYESATDSEIQTADTPTDYSEYLELSSQDIFQPEDYTGYVITDNPGTRVFIFSQDGTKTYKVIFVKNEQRLKVIDLINNELIMDNSIN
ncbi:MAG TPA: hypothetical protein K8W25_05340 [Aerococcus urinaeequi]|nr:hypothetical protein [Aerococcus urinaeequi]